MPAAAQIVHDALRVDEILDQIFRNLRLVRDGGRQPRNPTQQFAGSALLSAALTCKTLFEPAMRHLWHNIAGLDLLLLTMGQDIIGFKYDKNEPLPPQTTDRRMSGRVKHVILPRAYLTFKREPTEEDWEPFDRYAKYVERFGRVTEDWGPTADRLTPLGAIIDALQIRFANTPILPNLRHLLCVEDQLRYARLFLAAPGLRVLNVHIRTSGLMSYGTKVELGYFFTLRCLSKLESARFQLRPHEPDLSPAVSQAILDLADLKIMPKTLDICGVPLTPEAFKAVLMLNQLKSISVDLQRFNLSAFTDFCTNPKRVFDKLEIHSHVLPTGAEKGGTLERCFHSRLLQQFNSSELLSFTFIGGPPHPTPQDLSAAFETLMGSRHYAKLQSIYLEGSKEKDGDGSNQEAELDPYICTLSNAFHVLCQPHKPGFPHLQSIFLPNVFVDLADEDFDPIGRSLPSLKTFIVGNRREGRSRRPRTTLIGLWFLAKHCRHLTSFGIWMNAIFNCSRFCALLGYGELDKPTAEVQAIQLVAQVKAEKMTTLDVGDSFIENSIVVNRFLSTVAPNLRNVVFNRQNNSREVNTLWAHVGSQISVSLGQLP